MGISTITSSSEGVWSRNPDTMPISTGAAASYHFKSAANALVSTDAAGSQTTLATRGATASITVNDTFVTVCDVSGSGFLFHVLSAGSNGTDLRTLRITIDGAVYTIITPDTLAQNNRLVLGPVFAAGAIAVTDTGLLTSHSGLIGGYNSDFVGARDGGGVALTADILIPTENEILSFNLPAIRFSSSLKVEAKSQTISLTADPYNAAIALYRVDL